MCTLERDVRQLHCTCRQTSITHQDEKPQCLVSQLGRHTSPTTNQVSSRTRQTFPKNSQHLPVIISKLSHATGRHLPHLTKYMYLQELCRHLPKLTAHAITIKIKVVEHHRTSPTTNLVSLRTTCTCMQISPETSHSPSKS